MAYFHSQRFGHRCARWVEFLGHPPTSTPKNGIYPHPKIWQVQTLSTPRKCSGVEQSPSASEASAKFLLNKIFSKINLFSKKSCEYTPQKILGVDSRHVDSDFSAMVPTPKKLRCRQLSTPELPDLAHVWANCNFSGQMFEEDEYYNTFLTALI